ncbi:MAG: hypothetical protein ACRD04_14770 [Terriglobales bacterium]
MGGFVGDAVAVKEGVKVGLVGMAIELQVENGAEGAREGAGTTAMDTASLEECKQAGLDGGGGRHSGWLAAVSY